MSELPLEADATQPLAETVEHLRMKVGTPALAVGVYQGADKLFIKKLVLVDWSTGRSADAGTPFCIGSTSKLFVGLTTRHLAAGGLIDLDTPLSRTLPTVADAKRATLRMLATNQAGCPNCHTINQFGDATGRRTWRVGGDSLHDVSGDALSKCGAAGDLRSSLPDLCSFTDAAFRDTVLVSASRLSSADALATGAEGYRYGLAVEVQGAGAAETLEHCGLVPGYSACLSYRPHDDTAVVVLTNVYGTPRTARPALAVSDALFRWLASQPSS
ncbi:MAG: serine hydrolase domain-containing protein [Bacteroidota bacterium]